MGMLSKLFNFDNIGEKIKTLTKWICWTSILVTWIVTPFLILYAIIIGGTAGLVSIVVFPIAAFAASVGIWIGSWTTYAFGEYVENIQAIKDQMGKLYTIDRNVAAMAKPAIDEANKQPTSPKPIETAKSKMVPVRTDKLSKTNHTECEYVSGRTYTDGDIVIFEGKKYTCVVAHTVWSPSVSPSQWQENSPSETEQQVERQAEDLAKREAVKAAPKREKTLAEKLEYALAYQSDEGMVSYLKGIHDNRVDEILESPQHSIREQIRNLLDNM